MDQSKKDALAEEMSRFEQEILGGQNSSHGLGGSASKQYLTKPLQKQVPLLPQKPHPAPPPAMQPQSRMLEVNQAVAMEMTEGLVQRAKEESKMAKDKKKKLLRYGGGRVWMDHSLDEWDPNDYRIFCGDLGNDVNDEILARSFRHYPSFQKAKVIRDKHSKKSKGFGFVSFKDPHDFMNALKEMNGKYIGTRPVKLRKSTWKERNLDYVRKKEKEKQKLGLR